MINELNEIKDFENEKLVYNNRNDIFKNKLADQLVSGMGDKMINYIKNPPNPKKSKILKIKIKHFFDNLFQTI